MPAAVNTARAKQSIRPENCMIMEKVFAVLTERDVTGCA